MAFEQIGAFLDQSMLSGQGMLATVSAAIFHYPICICDFLFPPLIQLHSPPHLQFTSYFYE